MSHKSRWDILNCVLRNKNLIIMFMVLMILLVSAVVSTRHFLVTKTLDSTEYPPSTLLPESDGKHEFRSSKELENTFGCPSLPYDFCVPGEILDYTDSRISFSYNDMTITMLETEEDSLSALNGRLCTYAMDTVDVPKTEWVDIISATGYANGYPAEYHAGYAKVATRLNSYVFYGVLYEIKTEHMKNFMIYISCEDKGDLAKAKELLDAIIYTLKVQEDIGIGEATELTKAEDEERMEDTEELNDTEDVENEVTVTEENGIKVYSTDYSVYVGEKYENGLCVVFKWINDAVEPITFYLTDPDGKKYEKDEELSREGEWVFRVPDNIIGTYTIHGETTATILVNYYEAISIEQYYATYRNQDFFTGEPKYAVSE